MPRGVKKQTASPVVALADYLAGIDDKTIGLAMEIRARIKGLREKAKQAVADVAKEPAPAKVVKKVAPAKKAAPKPSPRPEPEAAPVNPAPRTGLLGRKLGGRGKGAE